MTPEIRRLTYADLPQVIAIERRAFPAPWSLAMFVLELSKPAGICLAAVEGNTVVGYLICSRYDTVWHVMNIAVDPKLQHRGLGSAMLTQLVAAYGWDGMAQHIPLRCFSNDPSIGSSLKFLRRTPWARARLESLYLWHLRELRRQEGR